MSNTYRNDFVRMDDALRTVGEYNRRKTANVLRMRRRRSEGVLKVTVTHKKQELYLWSGLIYDNKGEFDNIPLPGRFPLRHHQGDIYVARFQVPRGAPVELLVRYFPGSVMLTCPGRPWKVSGMIGKCKNGEANITTGPNVSGKGTKEEPYVIAQLPATCE